MELKQRIGLLGHPVSHSQSPALFAPLFDTDLLDWEYQLLDTGTEKELFEHLLSSQYTGFNVTIPYKQTVLKQVANRSPRVARIGAANTLYRLENGSWMAENTDYDGFLATFNKGRLEWNFAPKQALILGTGGSSKAVQAVLEDLQLPYQCISRTPSTSNLTYERLLSGSWESCLVVNCTPVGMTPDIDSSPLADLSFLKGPNALIDLVYNPSRTRLMEQFQSLGHWATNGSLMLRVQAEAAWKLFRTHTWNPTSA
jgi:shikimate dehydrogenase